MFINNGYRFTRPSGECVAAVPIGLGYWENCRQLLSVPEGGLKVALCGKFGLSTVAF